MKKGPGLVLLQHKWKFFGKTINSLPLPCVTILIIVIFCVRIFCVCSTTTFTFSVKQNHRAQFCRDELKLWLKLGLTKYLLTFIMDIELFYNIHLRIWSIQNNNFQIRISFYSYEVGVEKTNKIRKLYRSCVYIHFQWHFCGDFTIIHDL